MGICRKKHLGRRNIRWSRNLAYVVGLLATDGCLSKDKRHIDFTSNDRDLINTFKDCLRLDNKVCLKKCGDANRVCSRIQFGDVRLYRFLLSIGLMPNKTKILGKLNIPDKYFFDFLRGILDGDGYIQVYQDSVYPNSQRLYTRFACASLRHLMWLRKRIKYYLRIKGSLQETVKKIFELRYAKSESVVLLQAIYYSRYLPCLKRKRDIAEPFLLICGSGETGKHLRLRTVGP